jgi:hypothetical protein
VIENFVIRGGCPDTPEGFVNSPYLLKPEFNDKIKHIYGAVGAGGKVTMKNHLLVVSFILFKTKKVFLD